MNELNELCNVRTKWKMIGLGLRLQLSDLEAMSGSPQDCLARSMSKWLKGVDSSPTWQAIVAPEISAGGREKESSGSRREVLS